MTQPAATAAETRPLTGTVDVEVVVPVHNEEHDLASSVRRLHDYLREQFPFTAVITIVDNASTDSTWTLATALAADLDGVRAVRLAEKGRGRALRQAWGASTARVVAYMDVDLSTDLRALSPLVAPLLSGHSDLAIGSRLAPTARVVRGPKREVISRCYNLLLRTALRTRFHDAQCGFKAIRTDHARLLLPHVQDPGWFFDTELLVLAERSGLRIAEVPVDWVDDPDTRVDIVQTAAADLRGILRVGRDLATGRLPVSELRARIGRAAPAGAGTLPIQALRFAGVGAVSTLAYLLLYLLLRPMGAQPANLLALLVTAVGNTAANRRFTFGVRGDGHARHHVQGLLVFGLGLGLTSGALALVPAHAPRPLELLVLITANLAATVLRFVLFRKWVFTR